MIFLTCDAFGVLPPVSSLSPAHAMYHFISGYTAKVAGTEMGVTEPQATFSPCFGGPFLVWHPSKYAELLAAKMKKHNARVWLVNTGWGGGGHGAGKRISLKHTRAIIDAIHSGALAKAKTQRDPVFGFDVVTECPERARRKFSSRATRGPTNPPTTPRPRSSPACSRKTSRPTKPARQPRSKLPGRTLEVSLAFFSRAFIFPIHFMKLPGVLGINATRHWILGRA